MSLKYIDTYGKDRTIIDNLNMYDKMYPVGSLFWTVVDKYPNAIFFGDNWETDYPAASNIKWIRVKGFVYATDKSSETDTLPSSKKNDGQVKGKDSDTYLGKTEFQQTVGENQGYSQIKLTKANLPPHTHNIEHYHDAGNMHITGNFGHWNQYVGDGFGAGAFTSENYGNMTGFKLSGNDKRTKIVMDAHKIDGQGKGGWSGLTSKPLNSNSGAIDNSGDSSDELLTQGIDYMPPYMVAYCWRRNDV